MIEDHMVNEYFKRKFYQNVLITSQQRFVVDSIIKDHMTDKYFKTMIYSNILVS